MSQPKEDLVPSLVIPYVISESVFLLDDVLDPSSFFDIIHEGLMGEDSYEGLALWFCGCHVHKVLSQANSLSICYSVDEVCFVVCSVVVHSKLL
jgi:hypothetical protein